MSNCAETAPCFVCCICKCGVCVMGIFVVVVGVGVLYGVGTIIVLRNDALSSALV